MIRCADCELPASGVWRIITKTYTDAKYLCAACGFHSYRQRRLFFVPSMRVELYKSFVTDFIASETPPVQDIPEKHWADHKLPAEKLHPSGVPISQFVAQLRRTKGGPSQVSSNIMNSFRGSSNPNSNAD